MKKFQNLIANKIKHKNNLLQADMMRVYPLTKKGQVGMTLYDKDMRDCDEGTMMAHLAAVSNSPKRNANRKNRFSKTAAVNDYSSYGGRANSIQNDPETAAAVREYLAAENGNTASLATG